MKFFVAGPVSVSNNMKHLRYEPIAHREKEFCDIFKRVTSKLLKVFKANPDYSVGIINGSETAAIESVLSSVVEDCIHNARAKLAVGELYVLCRK